MIGRILAAGDWRDLARLSTRVCVVGSGPAGAVVAACLAQRGIETFVLEAGSDAAGPGPDRLMATVDSDGDADLREGGATQLGGASNLWAGRLAALEAIDFEERPWVPHSGWPLARADLDPWLDQARALLGVASLPGRGTLPQRFEGLGGGIDVKTFSWAASPFNAGRHLKEAARTCPNLAVLLEAQATALLESSDGSRLTGVRARGPGGATLDVEAEVVILAAGGLGVPRLLLAPTAARPAGIGNEHDLVGRYLSTHPKADMAALLLDRSIATRHPLFSDRPAGSGRMRLGLGFDAATQREHGLLNHYVQLSPLAEYRASRLFEATRRTRVLQAPMIDRSAIATGSLRALGLMAFAAVGRVGGLQRRARTFVLRAFLDQFPNADNRVRLAREQDGNGQHKLDLVWRYSAGDRESVLRFLGLLDERLRQAGLGRVAFEPARDTGSWRFTGIHSHHMGTARMAASPRQGVADADGRVFSCNNLYIAGPPLFATYGYANPVLTTTALSLRLARHLEHRLG